MCSSDNTRVFTAQKGVCRVSVAVGHLNCDMAVRRVCKRGDYFAALHQFAVLRLASQITQSRVCRTVAELCAAVAASVDLYNEQWLPETNGLFRPAPMCAAWSFRRPPRKAVWCSQV